MFPPILLLDVTDDMAVMKEEIFGPILPVVTYDELEEAIAYVNAGPRPLALYFFGADSESQRRVLERTTSGGVLINDTTYTTRKTTFPSAASGQVAWALITVPKGSRP